MPAESPEWVARNFCTSWVNDRWRQNLKASVSYRIASFLLLLWAAGHTLGFRTPDPNWRADSVITSMQSLHFDVEGFSRRYWDFFSGFGLFVSVFLLFAAVLAWQLAGLPAERLALMRPAAWSLAICFGALTILSWAYFFALAGVFSSVITVCLTVAASLPAKSS